MREHERILRKEKEQETEDMQTKRVDPNPTQQHNTQHTDTPEELQQTEHKQNKVKWVGTYLRR